MQNRNPQEYAGLSSARVEPCNGEFLGRDVLNSEMRRHETDEFFDTCFPWLFDDDTAPACAESFGVNGASGVASTPGGGIGVPSTLSAAQAPALMLRTEAVGNEGRPYPYCQHMSDGHINASSAWTADMQVAAARSWQPPAGQGATNPIPSDRFDRGSMPPSVINAALPLGERQISALSEDGPARGISLMQTTSAAAVLPQTSATSQPMPGMQAPTSTSPVMSPASNVETRQQHQRGKTSGAAMSVLVKSDPGCTPDPQSVQPEELLIAMAASRKGSPTATCSPTTSSGQRSGGKVGKRKAGANGKGKASASVNGATSGKAPKAAGKVSKPAVKQRCGWDVVRRQNAEMSRLEAEVQEKLMLANNLEVESQELRRRERLLRLQVANGERTIKCQAGGVAPHLIALVQTFRSSVNQMHAGELLSAIPKNFAEYKTKDFMVTWQGFVDEVSDVLHEDAISGRTPAVEQRAEDLVERFANWCMSLNVNKPMFMFEVRSLNMKTGEVYMPTAEFWAGVGVQMGLSDQQRTDLHETYKMYSELLRKIMEEQSQLMLELSQLVDQDLQRSEQDLDPKTHNSTGEQWINKQSIIRKLQVVFQRYNMLNTMLNFLVFKILTAWQFCLMVFHCFPSFPNMKLWLQAACLNEAELAQAQDEEGIASAAAAATAAAARQWCGREVSGL